jgi:enterochelin esterase-like enzyme
VVNKKNMKKVHALALLLILTGNMYSQSFQQFISYVNSLPENARQAKVDSFMNAGHNFPLTESDTLCNFIFKGVAQNVKIAGDFTGWNPNKTMIKIIGTDFFYYSCQFESDARLDYKYVLNGSNWILDPENPYTCVGGYGPNSELRMPDYIIPPEIAYYASIPHGTIRDTSFYSTNLGNTRTVKIYLPPYYDVLKQYPVILFHDGPEYISLGNASNIFDYLIFHQEIDPVIGIFVPPVDRTGEYAGTKKDAFTAFIVDELIPVIDQKYATSKDPHKRATVGASNGGNIALYIGMKHPETFGRIAAQSSNVESIISSTYQNEAKIDLELYLDIGTYDISVLIPLVSNFVQILQNKNYVYQSKIWHEGHSWGSWKGHLSFALRQFFAPGTGINKNPFHEKMNLYQNSPNPFKTKTRIDFTVPAGSNVELTIYDTSGKRIQTLCNQMLFTESNSILFNNPDLADGVYLYSLRVDKYLLSKKMNISN